MAKRKKKKKVVKKPIKSYDHKDKQRANNPPVGLVTPDTDPDAGSQKTYQYDPHLDPQLVWAGKAEHTSFDVPTVSLHVHERIDPRSIIEAVRKRNGNGHQHQMMLFEQPDENPPLREAIEFYKHARGWTNRLIAGDSLLVMNSLLEKEGMAGKVQMVYVDPPYGIRYGSNFQPFVNKRDVKDRKDEDLTQEPEMIRAFRDTWELGIHSYLTYLRDRLLLARELLHESGSCFVQISDENLHLVRNLMDEVFHEKNFLSLITYVTTSGFPSTTLSRAGDYLLWFAKDRSKVKYRQLFNSKQLGDESASEYKWLMLPDQTTRSMTPEEYSGRESIPKGARAWRYGPLTSSGATEEGSQPYSFQGKEYSPGSNNHWKVSQDGLEQLKNANFLVARKNSLAYYLFLDFYPVIPINNNWTDTKWGFDAGTKEYVVQTNLKVIQRCLQMTTDPGDLVLDPTCGAGTTAFAAEQWGRRWITCDTSRVSISISKKRLTTALYAYFELAHEQNGVGSGFEFHTVPHIKLSDIAKNPEIKEGMTRAEIDAAIAKYADQETLYDQPKIDKSKARVTGPFTVEAVPAPSVRPLGDVTDDADESASPATADASVGRSGATLRQDEWRDELLKCGIRGKGGQHIHFTRVEALAGTRWLHADAETTAPASKSSSSNNAGGERVVISFGPEHAPLEQRQVEQALEEAQLLKPSPKLIVFASFQFDPEAAKDIDETNWPGVALLKVQMNTDLLTDDLKKKRSSNESFWMIGQPDVEARQATGKDQKGKWEVEVHGFDYYNPKTGKIESGDTTRIAMWMLDTDYDGRSLYPSQVFFPMAGPKDGWARLAKNLKAEIDEELIEAYRGTVSLPFEAGKYQRVAVKIVDDRGIESLKIVGIS